MRYHASEEMYLETMLLLQRKNPFIRSIDIAIERGYSKSGVSVTMKKPVNEGLITVESGGRIELTALGERRAGEIREQGRLLTELLMKSGAMARADRFSAWQENCGHFWEKIYLG